MKIKIKWKKLILRNIKHKNKQKIKDKITTTNKK